MPLTARSGDFKGEETGWGIGALGAHQWHWGQFNLMLGAGLAYYLMNSDITMRHSSGAMMNMSNRRLNGVMPHFEATAGFAF